MFTGQQFQILKKENKRKILFLYPPPVMAFLSFIELFSFFDFSLLYNFEFNRHM